METNEKLLTEIDAITLSPANRAWREAVRTASWRIHPDRQRLALQSWRETEGEDLELRRAKLLARVLEGMPIDILPFDQIVGRSTPAVIGCAPAMDICGDYIPAIWNEDRRVDATMDASVQLDEETLSVLREAALEFRGKTAPDLSYQAWEAVCGTLGRDLKDAKVKPEEHEDLIVRIGGFSAYFVQLSGEIQDDVIFRSELSL